MLKEYMTLCKYPCKHAYMYVWEHALKYLHIANGHLLTKRIFINVNK